MSERGLTLPIKAALPTAAEALKLLELGASRGAPLSAELSIGDQEIHLSWDEGRVVP